MCMFVRLRKTIIECNVPLSLHLMGIFTFWIEVSKLCRRQKYRRRQLAFLKLDTRKRPMRQMNEKLFLRKVSSRIDRCAASASASRRWESSQFTHRTNARWQWRLKCWNETNEQTNYCRIVHGPRVRYIASMDIASLRERKSIKEKRFYVTRNACSICTMRFIPRTRIDILMRRLHNLLDLSNSDCVGLVVVSYTGIFVKYIKSSLHLYFVYIIRLWIYFRRRRRLIMYFVLV